MKIIPHYSRFPDAYSPRLHLLYVLDENRLQPYRRAIPEVVERGMTVLDLGTGTGVLARMALEAGAERVIAVDRDPEILRFAERANLQAGVSERIRLIAEDIRNITSLNAEIDLVVSELIGGLVEDEFMTELVSSARENLLKKGGSVVPRSVRLFVAPVEIASDSHRDFASVVEDDLILEQSHNIDPYSTYYEVLGLGSERLLSPAQETYRTDLTTDQSGDGRDSLQFNPQKSGTLTGFAFWFSAELSPSVQLETSPTSEPTCWGQVYLPLAEPVKVSGDDSILFEWEAYSLNDEPPRDYDWEVQVARGNNVRYEYASSTTTPVLP